MCTYFKVRWGWTYYCVCLVLIWWRQYWTMKNLTTLALLTPGKCTNILRDRFIDPRFPFCHLNIAPTKLFQQCGYFQVWEHVRSNPWNLSFFPLAWSGISLKYWKALKTQTNKTKWHKHFQLLVQLWASWENANWPKHIQFLHSHICWDNYPCKNRNVRPKNNQLITYY